VKLNWNFQRGGGVLEKILFMGEVWIFSGTTQYKTINCTKIINYKFYAHVHCRYFADQRATVIAYMY